VTCRDHFWPSLGDVVSETTLNGADVEAFRFRCRAFLEAYEGLNLVNTYDVGRHFLQSLADAGLAGLTYPREWGGAGLTKKHDEIWREEKADFPYYDRLHVISHGMCLPMIDEYGTEDQKQRYEADMISGRTLWCQMFSEPGAGSDVASLQMTAVLDGEEWVMNGQKVWTTYANQSDFGIILARTDSDVPKHAGISMFILDMRSAGVDVRPIHQIDGGSEFNEVFLSDVRVPSSNLIGAINDGWRLATSMLMYERVAIGSGATDDISHPYYDLLVAQARRSGHLTDPVTVEEITRIYVLETCKALVALRTRAEAKAGKTPGPGGSLGKLFGSIIAKEFRTVGAEIVGPGSIAWADDDELRRDFAYELIVSFRTGIAGGTDEIQRNIIGDRVLGLPREPAVDREVPFRDLKVGTQRT
jgi:alkylation response protein AidB-like acyl-CoA dehydrogenase